MPRSETKKAYTNIDNSKFSDPKLTKAYAKLRKAFDQAAALRESVVEPARKEFDDLLKTHLVKKGEAEGEEYLEISHRYGLAFHVSDEPIEEKAAKTKKRIVSV